MFKESRVFISGGTGSWSQELTKQLLKKEVDQIVIYSRSESPQVEMERALGDRRIKYVIGDVRDRDALKEAMRGVDYVFHAAALKHVPICENQMYEAMKTNIYGTQNMIDCAIENRVKKFVNISTDKVVDPANLYGLTKAVAEKMTIQANCRTKETDFIVTRTGNVLGSHGSILPFMIDQIRRYNLVKVTDVNMCRFFLTLPQAIDLLFFAMENGKGGEIFVKDIEAFYITNLATILKDTFGDKDTGIQFIGVREGEKVDEALIAEHEGLRTYFENGYYVIYPQIKTDREYDKKGKVLGMGLWVKDRISTAERLKELLIEGELI